MENLHLLQEFCLQKENTLKQKHLIEMKRLKDKTMSHVRTLPEYKKLITYEKKQREKARMRGIFELCVYVLQVFSTIIVAWNGYYKVSHEHPFEDIYPYWVAVFSSFYEIIACIVLWENTTAGLYVLWPSVGALSFSMIFATTKLGETMADIQGGVAVAELVVLIFTLLALNFARRFPFFHTLFLVSFGFFLAQFIWWVQ